jgi:hypothetical protein
MGGRGREGWGMGLKAERELRSIEGSQSKNIRGGGGAPGERVYK